MRYRNIPGMMSGTCHIPSYVLISLVRAIWYGYGLAGAGAGGVCVVRPVRSTYRESRKARFFMIISPGTSPTGSA